MYKAPNLFLKLKTGFCCFFYCCKQSLKLHFHPSILPARTIFFMSFPPIHSSNHSAKTMLCTAFNYFGQFCSKLYQPISSASATLFWPLATFWNNQNLIFLYKIDAHLNFLLFFERLTPFKFNLEANSSLNLENRAIFWFLIFSRKLCISIYLSI